MANQEQVEILRQGADFWNKWLKKNSVKYIDLREALLNGTDLSDALLYKADLSEADLRNANLSRAWLEGASLWEAELTGAVLKNTDLKTANLSGAFLTKANLNGADLFNANLQGAVINDADVTQANLRRANLQITSFINSDLRETNFEESWLEKTALVGANLSESNFGYTIIAGVNLGRAKGLWKIQHKAPSYIDFRTIATSEGKIPSGFLRGCGLSDLDIEYAKLAAPKLSEKKITDIAYKIHELRSEGVAVLYYSTFISYSSKDEGFTQRLYNDLQNSGVRCWFAPKDLKTGDKIRPRIDQEIRFHDKLLVVLSKNSIQSEWVGDEVEAALEEESVSGRLVLFPIRLDEAVMDTRDDWAAKIKRRRHIGDFSNWKDEGSYQKAFERLLRDLKAGGKEVRVKDGR